MVNQAKYSQLIPQEFFTNKPICEPGIIRQIESSGIRLDLVGLDQLDYLTSITRATLEANGLHNLKQLASCSGIQLTTLPYLGIRRVENICFNTSRIIQQIANNEIPCMGNIPVVQESTTSINASGIKQPIIEATLIQELEHTGISAASIPVQKVGLVSDHFLTVLGKLGILNVKQLAECNPDELSNIPYMGFRKLQKLRIQVELFIRNLIAGFEEEQTRIAKHTEEEQIRITKSIEEEQIRIGQLIEAIRQVNSVFKEKEILGYICLPVSMKHRIKKFTDKQSDSLAALDVLLSHSLSSQDNPLSYFGVCDEIVRNLEAKVMHGNLNDELIFLQGCFTERELLILEKRFSPDVKETLDDIGKQLKITRERVRQIQTKAQKRLAETLPDLWLPYSQVSLGLLRKEGGDATFSSWQKQLNQIGIITDIGHLQLLIMFTLAAQSSYLELPIDFIASFDSYMPANVITKAKPIMHKARSVCRNSGAISLQSLFNQGLSEEYAELLLCSHGFREVSTGWWMRDDIESVAERVAYKVLTHCGPVTPHEMRNAVRRHLTRLGFPAPPSDVLTKLLERQRIAILKDGFLNLNMTFQCQPSLTSAEKIFLGIVNEIGPVVTFEIIHAKITDAGLSTPSVTNLLRLSPLVYKISSGIYTRVGLRYTEDDIKNAQAQSKRIKANSIIKPCSDGTIEFETNVGLWATCGGVVASGPATALGGNWPLYCGGKEAGDLIIDNNFIRGLSGVVRNLGIEPGDRISIEFDTWKRIATLRKIKPNVEDQE